MELVGRKLGCLRKKRKYSRIGTGSLGEGKYLLSFDRKGGGFHEGSVSVVSRSVLRGEFVETTYHVIDGEISSLCSIFSGFQISDSRVRLYRKRLRGRK